MKVRVDFDLCESNGLCEALAPEVFALDDDDYLQILQEDLAPGDLALDGAVRRAVAACPRAAISLDESP